jgi:hypothetical protein
MDDVVLLATDQSHALAAARLCNFPTGKAMLLPAHIAWLDNIVARLLRSLPDPWVDLYGYASHLGNHAFNKRLSFERCEAVRKHIKTYGLKVKFPEEFGAGDTQSTGTATDNSGAWRAVEVLVFGAMPPPKPAPSTDPKTVAESVKGDPVAWVEAAITLLSNLRSHIMSGLILPFTDDQARHALDHHFHMDSPESNMAELSFIIDRYKDILDVLKNQSGTVFRSVTDAQAMADEKVDKDHIRAAYTKDKRWPEAERSISFTSVFLKRKDDCQKVILIHESRHFVQTDPKHFDSPDIPEWRSDYNSRVKLPVTETIHNPSSYAAGAFELATGNDRRDFCK